MGNATVAVIFVVLLNVLMFIAQASANHLNPDAPQTFYNQHGSLLEGINTGTQANPAMNTTVMETGLPSAKGAVNPTLGVLFTDVFNSIKDFFLNTLGIKYFVYIVRAPFDLLASTGMPIEISFALGGLWYLISFFVIISFLWGRD